MTKWEWDAISDIHPKTWAPSYSEGLDKESNAAFAELLGLIMYAGSADDPVYLRIQKFHRTKISHFVAAGGDEADYEWNLRKKLVARIIVSFNRLLYALDPKGTRKLSRDRQDVVLSATTRASSEGHCR